jgi:Fe-S-cluster containining protein
MGMDLQKICIECQRCCRWITFTISVPNGTEANRHEEYYLKRGCKIKGKISGKEFTQMSIMIHSPCPELTLLFGCKSYHNRPVLCRLYDGRYDPLMECKLPI